MILVLDTNVVMELLHYRDPRSTALMHAITEGRIHCVTDTRCLAELQRVLAYPQFKLEAAAQHGLYAQYLHMTTLVDETPIDTPLPKCRDTDDQKFMEVAARCRADLLVTRDKELLRLARSRARPAPFGIVVPEKSIVAIAAMTNPSPEDQEIPT